MFFILKLKDCEAEILNNAMEHIFFSVILFTFKVGYENASSNVWY